MLTIVIEKPIQFTIVSAVPLDSAGAFCATKVENKGESAITTKPQRTKKTTKNSPEAILKIKGERKQHKPDKLKAKEAVCFTPNC